MIDYAAPELDAVVAHETARLVRHITLEAQRRAFALIAAPAATPATPLPAVTTARGPVVTVAPPAPVAPSPRATRATPYTTPRVVLVRNNKATDPRFRAWLPRVLAYCRGKTHVPVSELLEALALPPDEPIAESIFGYIIATAGGRRVRTPDGPTGYSLPPVSEWRTDPSVIVLADVRPVSELQLPARFAHVARAPVSLAARSRVLNAWEARNGANFLQGQRVECYLAREAELQQFRARRAEKDQFGTIGMARAVLIAHFATPTDGRIVETTTHPVSGHGLFRIV